MFGYRRIHKVIRIIILTVLIASLQFSCTITVFEIEEGSKLLEDGLWRLYIDDLRFGENVDIHNNTAIVSAKGDSLASVRVFEFCQNNWTNTAFLTEEDITQNYGNELAIGDNIIAISDDAGSKVYTYIRSDTTWEKLGTIVPPGESDFSYFGSSLDIYGNYLIVGSKTGPAVLYELVNDNWLEISSLDVGDEQENSYEIQVRLSENFLATCKGRDIYVHNRSGSTLSNRTLVDSTRNNSHSAYYRIDIDDSTLVVGEPETYDYKCKILVYEFENDQWINKSTIRRYIDRDYLGNSIEICSDHILFGILSYELFSSNYFMFYSFSEENDSSDSWVSLEDISGYKYRGDFSLSNEFAIFSGRDYAYIYEYK